MEQITTRLSLDKQDLILIEEMTRKVNRALGKFCYASITPENLKSIAWETKQIAMQVVGGHLFFNHIDNCFYSFSHMRISVHKIKGTVEIKPCYKKEMSLFDRS